MRRIYSVLLGAGLAGTIGLCAGLDVPARSDQMTVVPVGAKARRIGENGGKHKRQALAGPDTQPSADAPADQKEHGPGHALFRLMDRNRDGKLQPAELNQLIDLLKNAETASEKSDLTPEDWDHFAEQLRGHKALKGKGKFNKI